MSSSSDLTTLGDAVRQARDSFRRGAQNRNGESSNDIAKWLIIAAAILGAFMLARSMRRLGGVAFGLFWIWFWTHRGVHHIF